MPAIMTSRQAAELNHAFERNGWTAEDVKELSKGNTLAKILRDLRGQVETKKEIKTEALIDFFGTVTFSARSEKFNPRDNFVVDTSKNAKVKIWGLGQRFEEEFLDKIEESSDGYNVCYGNLRKPLNKSLAN